jgi:hypothetical protein
MWLERRKKQKQKQKPHAKKNTLRPPSDTTSLPVPLTTPSSVVSRPHDSHRVPPTELNPDEAQSQIVRRKSLLADEIFPCGALLRPKARSRIKSSGLLRKPHLLRSKEGFPQSESKSRARLTFSGAGKPK